MTIRELREQIQILDENAVNTNKMKVEMYNRFALPLASLVCAIVGAPLGMQKQRGSSSIGFGISVVVIFIYYTIDHDAGERPWQRRTDTAVSGRVPSRYHLRHYRRGSRIPQVEING